MKKKTMAMILSFSMVFTGLGMEAVPQKAAAVSNSTAAAVQTEADSTETPEVTSVPEDAVKTPDASQETKEPAQESGMPAETDQPEKTPVAATEAPAQTPVNTPAATGGGYHNKSCSNRNKRSIKGRSAIYNRQFCLRCNG